MIIIHSIWNNLMKTQPSKLFFKIQNPYAAAPGGKISIAWQNRKAFKIKSNFFMYFSVLATISLVSKLAKWTKSFMEDLLEVQQ